MLLWVASAVLAPVPAPPPATAACPAVWTVEAIRVKPGMMALARRYFDRGWSPARREALKRGQIKNYRLLVTNSGGASDPQIQLVTEYADQAQFAAREANFDAIFNALKIPRPITVDGKARADLFESTVGRDDYRQDATTGRSCS